MTNPLHLSLQGRLTIWSILVMALIVGVVTTSDLIGEVDTQFAMTLQRAELLKQLVTTLASSAADRDRSRPVAEVIRESPDLGSQLLNLLTATQDIVDIVITDPGGAVISGVDPDLTGTAMAPLDPFRPLVERSRWWTKVHMLLMQDTKSYQISQEVADQNHKVQFVVHVVVAPPLIQQSVMPILRSHARVSLLTIAGAIFGAFVFSTIAFRPLGKLGRMLDLMAQGKYELQPADEPSAAADEFGVVVSKVSLLGQQLRGAQTEISDLKGNFERLLEEMEDAVLIFGRDLRLIAAAGAIERFLSRPRGEMIGQSLVDIFPGNTSLGLILMQARHTGRTIRNRPVPLSNHSSDPHHLQIAMLTVEFLGVDGGLIVRLRDPEATRQIGRQLQTADRLSAISRLTGGVAHEVKNPLNAILMHVELARMKLAHGDYDVNPQMDVISSEILRLDRVVKTFLDFTRPVKLNLMPVPVDSFVRDVVELASPHANGAGVAIEVLSLPESVLITVDSDLVKQAVLNIVINAIEAMPNGGTLLIEARERSEDAEIRITDSGSGIPPEVKEKIYNLYFTTKQHGSGIGLAMTYRIVQLHDGTIDFVSEPGKGTTFILRFPIAVPQPGIAA
ncbi:MAG TPA: hypothetical protein DEQ47_13525 [Solibacterales bacterium]|nr:hypothetical protein [Bryobacterales bacterium]